MGMGTRVVVVLCHVSYLCGVLYCTCVTLPHSLFSAGLLEERESKYWNVSIVWHPLLSPVCKDSVVY